MKQTDILRRMATLQYRITMNDRKPKSFGTEHLLYHSEIHLIDAIGDEKEINATELSKKMNITNGAVTQVTQKLIKKYLIKRYNKEPNQKTVYFSLTESGEIAYKNHKLFHKTLDDKVNEYLNGLTDDQLQGIVGLIEITEDYLPRL